MDLATVIDVITAGGLFGGSIVIIWLLLTDRLVTRGRVRAIEAERDVLQAVISSELRALREAVDVMRRDLDALRRR